MLKAIFFDLDNTLYDQTLFYDAAFGAVAASLSKSTGVEYRCILRRIWRVHKENGSLYRHLFDDIIAGFGLAPGILTSVIDIFHTPVPCHIKLFKGVEKLLHKLRPQFFLGIITNGNTRMQAYKIACLNIDGLFDAIIYTHEHSSPKPSSYCYALAAQKAGCLPGEALYVGDNPLVDFQGAYECGMHCAMMRYGEFSKEKIPPVKLDFQFDDYAEFEEKLTRCLSGRKDADGFQDCPD